MNALTIPSRSKSRHEVSNRLFHGRRVPATQQQRMQRVCDRVAVNHHRLLAMDANASPDYKLLKLGAWIGALAGRIETQTETESILTIIAAHAVGWVESNPGNVKDVFAAIAAERQRQIQLRTDNPKRYTFDLAHILPDPMRKFRVLFEEAGEVARECDHLEQTPQSRKVMLFLREELIQVAAVCVAWLESYEVQS